MIKSLDQVISQLQQLPEAEQERIAQIILREVEKQELKANDPLFSLENQPFVGMWKERSEMQNSSEWVRQLRQEQW
jgi:hypothetical protein